jgi:beta-lactam-binding protein with PASTA domain/predicted Ser/Thr protein kinase
MTNRYTTDPMSQPSPTVFNGRYELQRRLARGGMADVFLARDRLLDRPVAIKVLFPDLAADPAFVERFRREAQAAANLNHPNIVSIFDWGQQDDTYFIVMEFIDGRSLADLIRTQGVLGADRAAEITGDVAAALGFAHRSGVIHRDIKPGNVLITSDGQVKVADFGIATVLSDTNTDLTRAGTVMGTATYFSPEQAQGRSVDARSDLYSLGAVLFEMVAGRPPFKGDTPLAVAIKHVQEQPPSPRALGANIAESLEAITLKLLAKSPDNRYPTADDLRADLRRYREGMHSLRRAPALAVAAGPAPTQVVGAVPAVAAAGTGVHSQGTTVLPSAHSTTYYEPPPENRAGMIIAVTMLLLLSIAGLVFAFVKVLNDDDAPAVTNVEAPNLIDKSEEEARSLIRDSGFPEPQIVRRASNDKVAGTVFDQDPEAGKMVKPSTGFVLTISTGPESAFPPHVVGLIAAEAEKQLTDRGYVPQKVSQASAEVPEGLVISQDPPSDRQLPKGSGVQIRISTGGQEVDLPNVVNQPIDQVLTNLTNRKLKVSQLREASETIDADRVIRTDPQGPVKVKEGQTITVVVSDGQPRFEMPNVVGETEDAAKALLASKGLPVQIETQNVGADDPNAGKVIVQSQPAGSQVRKGTTVRLTIGKAPPPTTTTTTTTTTTSSTTTRRT